MKTRRLLHLCVCCCLVLSSCGQEKKKEPKTATGISETAVTKPDDFDATLDKSFYMTGDVMDDLYINVTMNKGELKTGTQVEIAKKTNPSEKIQATVYKIETRKFQKIETAKAGQEVVLFLKVKNDKNFSLGYTGDLYTLSAKGMTPPGNTTAATKPAKITIDGKDWNYENVKVYHYTRDDGKGITKSPANIMITFTKPNKSVKITGGEERLQINIYTPSQTAGNYPKNKLDVAFYGVESGKEITLINNKAPNLDAAAAITVYQSGTAPKISGKISSVTKQSFCSNCTNKKIEVSFENLPIEINAQ